MKKTFLFIGGIVLIGVLIFGYKFILTSSEFEDAFHSGHKLHDPSLVLLKTEISPNGQFRFFEYQFDNGGYGYSRVFWSVIKNDSTITDLEKGLLPDGYKGITWTSNNQLLIEKWEPYYFQGEEIELNDNSMINEVKIKLKK